MYKFNFIYKTTNLINDKIYIGFHSTNNLNDRYIGCGIKSQSMVNENKKGFHKAVLKYGYENFQIEIIENCIPCRHHISEREKFWIKELESKGKNGYNLTEGGGVMLRWHFNNCKLKK